ncbi:hypothetical protein MHY85_03070 [Cellulomonas sp. ACRRI]|uniref:hypothetical protein n=1 Tax=Cellulomonas sp. ACRRI TaxID=2918188 RepID=UPI001EF339A6|nr:hypothetical protein [Cellulomonas sp. ACRRI]MCG7284953.1 hypothetical protein [Cellulomonas sp. ACRRI]
MTVAAGADDPQPTAAIRELARRITRLQRQIDAGAHTPDLGLSAIEGGAIDGFTVDGQITTRTGEQHDGTFGSVTLAGPVPPTPTAPIAEGAPGMASIAWDGGFLEGALTPMDFARVEVYVSAAPIIDPMPAHLVGTIETPQGAEIVTRREAGTYYVRLASRSLAGKVSPLSEEVTVEVADLVDTAAIEDELAKKTTIIRSTGDPDEDGAAVGDLWWKIDGDGHVTAQWRWDGTAWQVLAISGLLIAAETITAAQIAAETITADRLLAGAITTRELASLAVTADKIAANAITASKIAAGAITADKIAAGSITADQMALGIFRTQRVANSGFEITQATGPAVPGSRTTIPGWSFEAGAHGTAFAFEYKTATAAFSGNGKAVLVNNGAGDDGAKLYSDRFEVRAGEVLRTTLAVMNTTAVNAGVAVWIRYYDATGAAVGGWNNLFVGYVPSSGAKYAGVPTADHTAPAGAMAAQLQIQNRRAAGMTTTNYLCVDDVAVYPVGVQSMDLSPGLFRMWTDAGVMAVSIDPITAKFGNVVAQNASVQGSLDVTGGATFGDQVQVYSLKNIWANSSTRKWAAARSSYAGDATVNAGTSIQVIGTTLSGVIWPGVYAVVIKASLGQNVATGTLTTTLVHPGGTRELRRSIPGSSYADVEMVGFFTVAHGYSGTLTVYMNAVTSGGTLTVFGSSTYEIYRVYDF